MKYRRDPSADQWPEGDAGNDRGAPASACVGASLTTPDAAPVNAVAAAAPPPTAAALLARSRSPALPLVPPFASSVLRMAASHACASIDSVIWRYQLLQWRTS